MGQQQDWANKSCFKKTYLPVPRPECAHLNVNVGLSLIRCNAAQRPGPGPTARSLNMGVIGVIALMVLMTASKVGRRPKMVQGEIF